MTVAVARFVLAIPGARSLKDKRQVVRRVKDRVRERWNAACAEVGALDSHQRAELAVAMVGAETQPVAAALDDAVRFVEAEADVVDVKREVTTYDGAELGADFRRWEP